VTLEDVVEEIVGELQDEHDFEAPRVSRLDGGAIVVDGSLPFDELANEGVDVPPREGAEEGETVAGYLVAVLGRLAHPGDRVRVGAFDAVVEDVRRRRVHRVSFTRAQPSPASNDAA
jgi:putative hemolysin